MITGVAEVELLLGLVALTNELVVVVAGLRLVRTLLEELLDAETASVPNMATAMIIYKVFLTV